MQYFLGSITTLIIIAIVAYVLKPLNNKKVSRIKYNQSHIFELVKPFLPEDVFIKKKAKKTQALEHQDKVNVKIIIIEDKAYWIKNNIFYVAEMDDGNLQGDTTKQVDTMSMSSVQLDQMLFIMDKLRDGKDNDSGSSGIK